MVYNKLKTQSEQCKTELQQAFPASVPQTNYVKVELMQCLSLYMSL
jgi:hypothetical protein